jgi:hypothetical protein
VTPITLAGDLRGLGGPDCVLAGARDLVAYAYDASMYRGRPGVVILPREAGRVPAVVRYAAESDACCDSAGTYWLKHLEISEAILDGKLRQLGDTGATIIATQTVACSMQLIYGLRKRHLDVQVVHPVELLAQAYTTA